MELTWWQYVTMGVVGFIITTGIITFGLVIAIFWVTVLKVIKETFDEVWGK